MHDGRGCTRQHGFRSWRGTHFVESFAVEGTLAISRLAHAATDLPNDPAQRCRISRRRVSAPIRRRTPRAPLGRQASFARSRPDTWTAGLQTCVSIGERAQLPLAAQTATYAGRREYSGPTWLRPFIAMPRSFERPSSATRFPRNPLQLRRVSQFIL